MMGINWIGLYTLIRRDVARIFRVAIQTLVSPLISAGLYIFIFGAVIGTRIEPIEGIEYISFVFPGILMMSILTAAFMHSSSTMYFSRFIRTIQEVLVAPFTHIEIMVWLVGAALVRAMLIAFGVLAVGMVFGAVTLASLPLFFLYAVSVATIFALIGILVGLWANGFEQLNVLNTFVIMPFSYLGGMFYSVSMLPSQLQILAHANPFFYFVDGLRYAMTGFHESNLVFGLVFVGALVVGLGGLVYWCLKIGWRIRE